MHVKTVEVAGIFTALHAMRNPMNSWDKSDSHNGYVGPNDKKLAKSLITSGTEHAKFMRAIYVSCEIWAPMYWWQEADTYHFTVRNSCSKMHKLTAAEFTMDDFEHSQMTESGLESLQAVVNMINAYRRTYLLTRSPEAWRDLLLLLPDSYIQRSTWTTNYATLRNVYFQRRNHKLPEWHMFCDWIRTLPESWMITCEGVDDDNDAE